jgi:hypothetical protein
MGVAVTLSACASQSANMQVGTSISYLSISDQREAARTVQEYPTAPIGAKVLGQVDASRCHRNALDEPPSNDALVMDLKVAAYARGADGLTDIQFSKESGLLKNCWFVITARANAIQMPR